MANNKFNAYYYGIGLKVDDKSINEVASKIENKLNKTVANITKEMALVQKAISEGTQPDITPLENALKSVSNSMDVVKDSDFRVLKAQVDGMQLSFESLLETTKQLGIEMGSISQEFVRVSETINTRLDKVLSQPVNMRKSLKKDLQAMTDLGQYALEGREQGIAPRLDSLEGYFKEFKQQFASVGNVGELATKEIIQHLFKLGDVLRDLGTPVQHLKSDFLDITTAVVEEYNFTNKDKTFISKDIGYQYDLKLKQLQEQERVAEQIAQTQAKIQNILNDDGSLKFKGGTINASDKGKVLIDQINSLDIYDDKLNELSTNLEMHSDEYETVLKNYISLVRHIKGQVEALGSDSIEAVKFNEVINNLGLDLEDIDLGLADQVAGHIEVALDNIEEQIPKIQAIKTKLATEVAELQTTLNMQPTTSTSKVNVGKTKQQKVQVSNVEQVVELQAKVKVDEAEWIQTINASLPSIEKRINLLGIKGKIKNIKEIEDQIQKIQNKKLVAESPVVTVKTQKINNAELSQDIDTARQTDDTAITMTADERALTKRFGVLTDVITNQGGRVTAALKSWRDEINQYLNLRFLVDGLNADAIEGKFVGLVDAINWQLEDKPLDFTSNIDEVVADINAKLKNIKIEGIQVGDLSTEGGVTARQPIATSTVPMAYVMPAGMMSTAMGQIVADNVDVITDNIQVDGANETDENNSLERNLEQLVNQLGSIKQEIQQIKSGENTNTSSGVDDEDAPLSRLEHIVKAFGDLTESQVQRMQKNQPDLFKAMQQIQNNPTGQNVFDLIINNPNAVKQLNTLDKNSNSRQTKEIKAFTEPLAEVVNGYISEVGQDLDYGAVQQTTQRLENGKQIVQYLIDIANIATNLRQVKNGQGFNQLNNDNSKLMQWIGGMSFTKADIAGIVGKTQLEDDDLSSFLSTMNLDKSNVVKKSKNDFTQLIAPLIKEIYQYRTEQEKLQQILGQFKQTKTNKQFIDDFNNSENQQAFLASHLGRLQNIATTGLTEKGDKYIKDTLKEAGFSFGDLAKATTPNEIFQIIDNFVDTGVDLNKLTTDLAKGKQQFGAAYRDFVDILNVVFQFTQSARALDDIELHAKGIISGETYYTPRYNNPQMSSKKTIGTSARKIMQETPFIATDKQGRTFGYMMGKGSTDEGVYERNAGYSTILTALVDFFGKDLNKAVEIAFSKSITKQRGWTQNMELATWEGEKNKPSKASTVETRNARIDELNRTIDSASSNIEQWTNNRDAEIEKTAIQLAKNAQSRAEQDSKSIETGTKTSYRAIVANQAVSDAKDVVQNIEGVLERAEQRIQRAAQEKSNRDAISEQSLKTTLLTQQKINDNNINKVVSGVITEIATYYINQDKASGTTSANTQKAYELYRKGNEVIETTDLIKYLNKQGVNVTSATNGVINARSIQEEINSIAAVKKQELQATLDTYNQLKETRSKLTTDLTKEKDSDKKQQLQKDIDKTDKAIATAEKAYLKADGAYKEASKMANINASIVAEQKRGYNRASSVKDLDKTYFTDLSSIYSDWKRDMKDAQIVAQTNLDSAIALKETTEKQLEEAKNNLAQKEQEKENIQKEDLAKIQEKRQQSKTSEIPVEFKPEDYMVQAAEIVANKIAQETKRLNDAEQELDDIKSGKIKADNKQIAQNIREGDYQYWKAEEKRLEDLRKTQRSNLSKYKGMSAEQFIAQNPDFFPDDYNRYEELSQKRGDGTITKEETSELTSIIAKSEQKRQEAMTKLANLIETTKAEKDVAKQNKQLARQEQKALQAEIKAVKEDTVQRLESPEYEDEKPTETMDVDEDTVEQVINKMATPFAQIINNALRGAIPTDGMNVVVGGVQTSADIATESTLSNIYSLLQSGKIKVDSESVSEGKSAQKQEEKFVEGLGIKDKLAQTKETNQANIIKKGMQDYLSSYAQQQKKQITNVKFDSVKNDMTAEMVSLNGEIDKVRIKYDAMSDEITFASERNANAVDQTRKQMDALAKSIDKAMEDGAINKQTEEYKKYEKAVQHFNKYTTQISDQKKSWTNRQVTHWNNLRQAVLDTGDAVNKVAKTNSQTMAVSERIVNGQSKKKMSIDSALEGNTLGLNNATYQQYNTLYNQLMDKQEEFRKNGTLGLKESQQELTKLALGVERYGKQVEALIRNHNKLNVDEIGEENLLALDDTQDLERQMRSFAGVAQDATKEQFSFNEAAKTANATLKDADGTVHRYVISLDELTNQLVRTEVETYKVKTGFGRLFDEIGSKFRTLSAYFVSSFGIQEVIQQVRQGVTYVREIDAALTELKKVTDETNATYKAFLQNMSATAGVVGGTTAELTSSAAAWARLGFSIEEAGELARSTAVLMNVSEFTDVNTATEALISSLQAFGYEANESIQIVDKLNIVGNNFAISSDGIASGLQRSASTLVAAGNSLEQSIAMLAAGNRVMQDPEGLGNALKVLSMRIRGTKTE